MTRTSIFGRHSPPAIETSTSAPRRAAAHGRGRRQSRNQATKQSSNQTIGQSSNQAIKPEASTSESKVLGRRSGGEGKGWVWIGATTWGWLVTTSRSSVGG
eukprot:7268134-Prymnesium_polylepis.1